MTGRGVVGCWALTEAESSRAPSAIAVDDLGGRVLFALGSEVRQWNYGAAQNSALALGSIRTANGAALGVTGLAFGGGRLFGSTVGNPWLYEISPATLVATPIATPQHFDLVLGLSFDSASGLFHAAVESLAGSNLDCDLYSIDLLNGGLPTFVGRVPDGGSAACVTNGVAYSATGSRPPTSRPRPTSRRGPRALRMLVAISRPTSCRPATPTCTAIRACPPVRSSPDCVRSAARAPARGPAS